MSWRTVFQQLGIPEIEEKGKQVAISDSLLSQFSHFPQLEETNQSIYLNCIPEEWIEFYEERAAIIEYDGGIEKDYAEKLAKLNMWNHSKNYKH